MTLVSDAHTTETMQPDGGATIEAQSIVRDLDIAMRWLAYPGRKNGTTTAQQIDFSRAGD